MREVLHVYRDGECCRVDGGGIKVRAMMWGLRAGIGRGGVAVCEEEDALHVDLGTTTNRTSQISGMPGEEQLALLHA